MNKTATNTTNATHSYQEPSIHENEIATKVMDAAFIVHREMGAGLLESVYEECMCDILSDYNLKTQRQALIPIKFRNKTLNGFRADLIIEDCVLVELKAVERLTKVHEAQILNYLKLSDIKIGFLMNFNVPLLKDGLRRFVNTNNRCAR
jgi:GxxExxY protein